MNTRILAAVFAAVLLAVHASTATTFTVTTTADSGAGSLRDAITQANAAPGNVIEFSIAGSGVQTIALASALPEIANSTTIDGTTQPGYAGSPLIVIDGGGTVDANGITVNYFASSSAGPVFKALCIVRFGVNGGTARHGIESVAGDAMTVTGCYIGIGADGATAMRNTGDGIVHRTPFATPGVYGGSTPADRNVISGNLGAGVRVEGPFATVIGNYIGTSANGMSAVPNGEGVLVTTNASTQVKIGTATAGQRNVISGNSGSGVHLMKASSVLGNVIGLAADGSTALGNGQHGVFLDSTSGTIGSTAAGAGNTISSNGGDGVRATGGGLTVQGNRIGTDSDGAIARGNTGYGVNVVSGTGDVSVSSNIISANGSGGVQIATTGKAGAANNFIGVNATATAKLGNNGNGITVASGLPNAGTQNDFSNNTIGGNTGAGIEFTSASVHDFYVRRNNIGTDSANTANLSNTGPGIRITGGAQDQTIGGPFFTNANDANRIAFNGGDGVEMNSRNFVTINFIHDNGGLAVDLLPNGVNPPTGGGELNTPVISNVTTTATDVTFTFTHDAKASTGYRGLFYRNDTADPSGHGEMQTYLGTMTWTSNGSGHFEGTATFPLPSSAAAEAPAEGAGEPSYTILLCTNGLSLVVNKSGELSLNFGGSIVPLTPKSVTNGTLENSQNTNHPINTFTGELFDIEATDLNLRGPMPLFFARYYASKIESDGVITSALGRNRLHNFDSRVIPVDATHATVALCSGRIMQFTKPASKWELAGPLDVPFQLVDSGGGFILADPRSQRMWTFDSNGVLQTIEDGRGNTQTLNYDNGKLVSVRDGLDRTLTLGYTSAKLTSVTDGTRTVSFTYSGSDLATATDALNHTTSYTYDGNGHLLSWQRPRSNVPYVQTYANERVSSQTEHPDGMTTNTTSLDYNTNTHETTITEPNNKQRVHVHDDIGQGTRFTDEEGHSVNMTYDVNQRRDSITDRLGRVTKMTYHLPSGKLTKMVEPDGATTSFAYAKRTLASGIAFYDLAKATYPDGTTRSFAYDAKGNLRSVTDQSGKKATFTYDTHGRMLTAVNATGGMITFTYDAKENLATRIDNDVGIGATTYTYDLFSRLTRLTHPDGTHLDIAYDVADRITSITDERGDSFTYDYDVNDNVSVVTDPAGKTTTYAYDELDRVTQITDRLGKASTRGYDSRGWLARMTDRNNYTTTLVRDSRQRPASSTDAGNATMSLGYNDEAELTSMTDPLSHTSTLVRNARGHVAAASDALGQPWQLQRDSLQRVTKMIDPLGRAMGLAYDKRGLVIGASRDGMGASSYGRDAAGRVVKITDLNKGSWSFGYSKVGRLTASTDPLGRKFGRSYDSRGRLATVALPEGGTCMLERDVASNVTRQNFSAGPDLHYTYDSLNRLLTADDSGDAGSTVTLTYDNEGRMLSSTNSGVVFTASYDDEGRLATINYNGQFVVNYTYDARNRLTRVTDSIAFTTPTQVDFSYDDAGRVIGITRSNGSTTTYTFDDADRRTRVQHTKGAVDFIDVRTTLNADGDVTQANVTAPLLPTVTAAATAFKFDKASQIITAGYSYDTRGRLTASPGHTFAWDAASRLRSIDSTMLKYNALGDVSSRQVTGGNAATFGHLYQMPRAPIGVISEGSDTHYYIWTPDGRLLYTILSNGSGNSGPTFYHFDRLGSTLAKTDNAGDLVAKYAYGPYGEALEGSSAADPFMFVGELGVRTEGPLYQMRARYYDPASTRFLSRDPMPPRLADVRTLDPYLYALGNPARYIDPTGAYGEEWNDPAFGKIYRRMLRKAQEEPEELLPLQMFDFLCFGAFTGAVRYRNLESDQDETDARLAYDWALEEYYATRPHDTPVEQPSLPAAEVFSYETMQAHYRSIRAAEEAKAEAEEWARPTTPVKKPLTLDDLKRLNVSADVIQSLSLSEEARSFRLFQMEAWHRSAMSSGAESERYAREFAPDVAEEFVQGFIHGVAELFGAEPR